MPRRRSALSILFLTVFLDLLGFGIVIPALPLLAKQFGASAFEAALLNSIYSLLQLLFAPIWGRLSDRIGRRPVLLVSICGAAVSYVGFAYAPSFALLVIARGLAGMCAANIATAQAYIADVTGPEERARGMGLIGAAFGLGFVLGPFMGGELHRLGERAPFLVAAALSGLNFLWALVELPEPRTKAERAAAPVRSRLDAFRACWKRRGLRLLLGLLFLGVFSFANLEGTFVFYAKDTFDYGEEANGKLFGYIGLLMAIVQGGLLRRLVRRFGERKLVATGMAMTGAGLLLLPLFGPLGLLLPLGLMAVGNAVNSPCMSALVSKQASRDEQGSVIGVAQSVSSLGRVLGPAFGGALYVHASHAAPYLAAGVLMAVAAGIAFTALPRLIAPEPALEASAQ